jgi:hypothetical protein
VSRGCGVIIFTGGAAGRALALALAHEVANVIVQDCGARVLLPKDEPPALDLDALVRTRYPARFEQECEPVYDDSYRRETARLRRENVWREKQARALFNARVNQDRRKRKQMRGIGRR